MVTKYTRVRFEPPRPVAALLMAGAALALTMGLATVIGQNGQPVNFTHNVVDTPAPVTGAVFGSGPALKPGDRILTNSGIVGTVVTVKEKTLTLRSADTKLEVTKAAIAEITERSGEASAA